MRGPGPLRRGGRAGGERVTSAPRAVDARRLGVYAGERGIEIPISARPFLLPLTGPLEAVGHSAGTHDGLLRSVRSGAGTLGSVSYRLFGYMLELRRRSCRVNG
jgi:hypothetical protein